MTAYLMPDPHATLTAVAHRIQSATRTTALAGAGVLAESGVPTFRHAQTGLWARHDPMQPTTPGAFAANPETDRIGSSS